MKTLVRVEHPKTLGGFWRGYGDNGECPVREHSKYRDIRNRHNSDAFPTPHEDRVLEQGIIDSGIDLSNYFFGFNSIEQLKVALTAEELHEFIIDLGFKVYLIKANNTVSSEHQTVFLLDEVISKEDISSLFILKD